MKAFEIFQTVNALVGLAALMYICEQLKRSLKIYARTGSFR